jgi:hypothetical protein
MQKAVSLAMLSMAYASEESLKETLTIVPMKNDYNLLNFKWDFQLPKDVLESEIDVVNFFP